MSQALATHFAHDALLPRAPGGMGVGAVLALAAHGALLLALTSTVQWRTSPPEVFSAELWSAVPQSAAPLPAASPPPPPAVEVAPKPTPATPPAPPPPPLQRDADIATEQARRLEAQRKAQEEKAAKDAKEAKAKAKADEDKLKADKLKADKQAAEAKQKREEAERKAAADAKAQAEAKAEAKAEDERLAKQREENLRRMIGQAGTGGTGGTGAAAQNTAPSASYVGRLIGLIKPNIVFTGQVDGNPSAEVEVRAAAGGSIISKRLVKSSGNKDWDEAVLRAIDRTATLPSDGGRVPPALILVFRPKD